MRKTHMTRRLSLLVGSLVLAARLAAPAAATAQTSDALASHGRGIAILPPVESPDAPGRCYQGRFLPWYSPVTPISVRWCPVVYIPYYRGFCPDRRINPRCGVPYGDAPTPGLTGPVDPAAAAYGGYTGAPRDEARLL